MAEWQYTATCPCALMKLSLFSKQAFAAKITKHHALARSLLEYVCARTPQVSTATASGAGQPAKVKAKLALCLLSPL